MRILGGVLGLFAAVLMLNMEVSAQTSPVSLRRASGEKLAAARGHYGRARTHLIAAVREFDKANAIVDPDALMDAAEFRNILLDRLEDLERVLAPQARASKGGVRYEGDATLLGQVTSAPPRSEER